MGSIGSALSAGQLSTSALNQLTVDVGFSTRVSGQTYSADVTYSNSEYLATDTHIIGAEATGTSLPSAENNLITRIDELV
jgi:hypothetical protein